MTEPLYTDDDVAAGAEALYEAAYSLTSLTVDECEGLAEAVLDAALPTLPRSPRWSSPTCGPRRRNGE